MAVADETSSERLRRRRHFGGQYSFSAFVDAQQAQAESLLEACRIMGEGLLQATADLGEAVAVVARCKAGWPPAGDGSFARFTAWPLSADELRLFDEAVGRALEVLARSAQRAIAILVASPQGVFL